MKTGKTWKSTLLMAEVYRDLIILWTAMGLPEKQIADMLRICQKTVGHHKRMIEKVNGIKGIAELTRYAIRYGYLEA